jgi:hypothetical protein
VTKHFIGELEVFKILFSDKRPPLLIFYKMNMQRNDVWTPIPKGRQKEAEAIGRFIEPYLE